MTVHAPDQALDDPEALWRVQPGLWLFATKPWTGSCEPLVKPISRVETHARWLSRHQPLDLA